MRVNTQSDSLDFHFQGRGTPEVEFFSRRLIKASQNVTRSAASNSASYRFVWYDTLVRDDQSCRVGSSIQPNNNRKIENSIIST